MQNFWSIAMAIAMIATALLIAGGAKLAMKPQTRVRGVLMIVAALVIVMNVTIWTV
jgi:hypothetical protein